MNWRNGLGKVVSLDADARSRVDEHMASLADPGATPLPEPEGPVDEDPVALAITRAELVARLGLEGEDADACLLVLGDENHLGLADGEDGGLLAFACNPRTFDLGAFAEGLGQRPVLLCGGPGAMARLFHRFRDVNLRPRVLGLVSTRLPTALNVAERVQKLFGVEVLEGVRDRRRGGWLVLSRVQQGPLVPVRAWDELVVERREGRAMPEDWGYLAHLRASGDVDVWPLQVRRAHTHEGEVNFQNELPPLPIGETKLDVDALNLRVQSSPVFSYQLVLGPKPQLRMSPMAELGGRTTEIVEALADIEGIELSFVDSDTDLDEPIIFNPRGVIDEQAAVVWAGAPGSKARLDGWCEAIRATGLVGQTLDLIDAATGASIEGPEARQAATALAEETELVGSLYLGAGSERRIYVGDPRVDHGLEDAAEVGWIALLEGTDELEPMFVASPSGKTAGVVLTAFEGGELDASASELSLQGAYLQGYSRPMLARGRGPGQRDDAAPLSLDAERCTGAGDCARICPTAAIRVEGEPARPAIDASACIRCMLCVERCETSALRPIMSIDGMLPPDVFTREAEQLRKTRTRQPARVLDGKQVEPPARLDPREAKRAPAVINSKPTVVLGLATVTLMEHTAALLVDGELVSAIEEERLVRERHYRWRHPTRPGVSLSSDICLRVEEAWPPRSIDAVLRTAGLTMDDVDIVALNGIPGRFRRSFEGGFEWRAPPVMRANSMVFVPHHMSHAASVYGTSGMDEAWVLSVDGRGDYETATVWRAEGHDIDIVDAVPWRPDCSFGGVYETFTRALGFGTHGQGSTMALAAYGEPSVDVSSCMSIGPSGRPLLSENAAEKLVGPYARDYDAPLEDKHYNLAASIQRALETTVGDYLEHHAGDLRGKNLALCGGVALNCRMNGILRDRFQPGQMHVPPGANDAGTAIGAAMIGHRELTGELPRLGLGHTHFGPSWSDEAIAAALKRMRVPFQRLHDVGDQVAQLLVSGRVVCWFQGPMEFGPRALGGRSITADPRRPELKDRLNKMKSRQDWRPFGPSVLAGRQSEWFVQDWDSRYMLFAIDVRPEKRDQIPVVVHHDGSTRPQMVHAEHQPRYHALISAFEKRTGVPMIVNTSFNRGGEPIVCTPTEALRSFVGLGADAIVLGNCLVRREMLVRR